MGYTPAHDLGVKMFAAIADCGTMPEGFTFRASNEVVDTLGMACTAISLNANRRYTIFHCCNPHLDPYDLEPGDFGLNWPTVPYESFKRACQARGEASALHGYWTVLDHFRQYWFSRNKAQHRLPVSDRALREDCPCRIDWTGALTKLRRSHDWVDRHRADWPYAVPQTHLDFDSLMARARHYADELDVPFDSTYPIWMRQALRRLVSALKSPEAGLLETKFGDVVFDLSRILRQNARIARERLHHPEIEREAVRKPVFIVGMNRSGTTFLHRLLARDKRTWGLRLYELIDPVLPPGDHAGLTGTPNDPRRARAEEVCHVADVLEALVGVHPFDIDEPEEDFPVLKMAFTAWSYAGQFHVPDYARWLAETGSREAYRYHRGMIRHYTWQRRQERSGQEGRWLFKMPFHLKELGTPACDLSRRSFHPEPSRARAGSRVLVQPGRAGPLGRHGAA